MAYVAVAHIVAAACLRAPLRQRARGGVGGRRRERGREEGERKKDLRGLLLHHVLKYGLLQVAGVPTMQNATKVMSVSILVILFFPSSRGGLAMRHAGWQREA